MQPFYTSKVNVGHKCHYRPDGNRANVGKIDKKATKNKIHDTRWDIKVNHHSKVNLGVTQ